MLFFTGLSPHNKTIRRSCLKPQSLISSIFAALAFTAGLQIVALAQSGGPAQSGWDVGAYCWQLGYGDPDNTANWDACVIGGCRSLHGMDDPDGMAACLKKTAMSKQLHEDEAYTEPTDEPEPDPADPNS